MSTLNLESLKVMADGRVLRAVFTALTEPASHGVPDWMPGVVAEQSVTISKGGGACEFLTSQAVPFNMGPMGMEAVTDATSTLTPGQYYSKLAFFDGSGNLAKMGCITGKFDSGPAYAFPIAAGKAFKVYFPEPVPTGHTARIYLSPVNGDGSDLREVVTGIPAGTTTYTINFPNVGSNQPPALLSWIVSWLIPASARVTYGESGVTATGPVGVIRDTAGNVTAAFTASAITNGSLVDADGWMTSDYGTSSNAVTIYVSSTRGSDTNAGTIAAPVATIAKAWTLLPSSSASRVRFLRGDTFTFSVKPPQKWGVENQPDQPLIFEDYWYDYTGSGTDPGTRPIIDGTNGGKVLLGYNFGGTYQGGSVYLRRLHLIAAKLDSLIGMERFVVSDCLMDDSAWTPNGDYTRRIKEAVCHRTSIFNSYVVAAEGNRVQGIHTHNTNHSLVSESVVDHCGYRELPPNEIRDIFNHNAYFQTGGTEVMVWGSWITRGGSHGLQIRGGGGAAYNMMTGNAIAGFVGMRGGYIRKNVVLHSDDLVNVASPGRGQGLSLIQGYAESPLAGVCEFNIAAHHRGTQPLAFEASHDVQYNGRVMRAMLFRHNTAYEHGIPFRASGTEGVAVDVYQNIFCGDSTDAESHHVYYIFTSVASLAWLTTNDNVLAHKQPALGNPIYAFPLTPKSHTFATWQALGYDVDSVVYPAGTAPTFVNGEFGLPEYAAAQGLSNETGIYAALRTRALGTFPAWYDVVATAWPAFRDAYTPTDVAEIDLTTFGFYGASDYRSGLPTDPGGVDPDPDPDPDPEPVPHGYRGPFIVTLEAR
jgi:hypothetical protein